MLILGITGGIGSGKTTVAEIFSLIGVPVYIADTESKIITATSPVVRQQLIALFGDELYDGNLLNKALLARHIFSDSDKLVAVNNIIHPEVKKHFDKWVLENKTHQLIILESAILFESRFNRLVDKTLTVYTPLEDRIKRTMIRDNCSREEVMNRINNQMPDEEKKELSDFVIVNDNRQSLIEQVLDVLKQLAA